MKEDQRVKDLLSIYKDAFKETHIVWDNLKDTKHPEFINGKKENVFSVGALANTGNFTHLENSN